MDGFIYKTLVKIVFILLLVIVSCGTETIVQPLPTCTQIDTTFVNDSTFTVDTTTVNLYQCL